MTIPNFGTPIYLTYSLVILLDIRRSILNQSLCTEINSLDSDVWKYHQRNNSYRNEEKCRIFDCNSECENCVKNNCYNGADATSDCE